MVSVELGHEDKSLSRSDPLPLCVDLDGTLLRSDLLIESALSLVARNPANVFRMIGWLFRGRAHLKAEIAKRAIIDTATLPYDKAVIDWLKPQAGTREIILCTASDQLLAHKVADYVACFSGVLASDGSHNLAGARKAAALVRRFGEKGFDYVGNARVDLDVWRHACHAIVVEHGNRLSRAAGKVSTVEKVFHYDRPSLKTWLKAIRIHQWIKNILIFLPLLASHRLFDARAVTDSALAFLCFGLCASSVYLTNDLLDLEADRQHKRKRHRPFAAGSIPLVFGPVAAIVLLVAAFVIAWEVHHVFFGVLASYYVLTTGYSLRFKRMMMLDVVVLAMLYTTRILAGTAAIHSKPSFWLLAFSMFIFLSLAMVKRYTELLALQRAGKVTANGRGYDVEDIPLVQSLGGSSGYMAVLVLALYIDSTASEVLYRHPHYLWLLCPLLLYWISRTWAIAHRGVMHDDPVVFAVTDNASRVILGIAAAIVVASV